MPRPDLVLLDLNLPRKDGCEVLEALRFLEGFWLEIVKLPSERGG